MKHAYIAGPYRAKTKAERDLNIESARQVGVKVARKGYMPLIPHSNTARFDDIAPDLPDEMWLKGTLEQMEKCDIVVLCPGYEHSSGTLAEMRRARDLGIPIYESTREVPTLNWLDQIKPENMGE